MRWALLNLDFDAITIVDSDQLLVRPGYTHRIATFLGSTRPSACWARRRTRSRPTAAWTRSRRPGARPASGVRSSPASRAASRCSALDLLARDRVHPAAAADLVSLFEDPGSGHPRPDRDVGDRGDHPAHPRRGVGPRDRGQSCGPGLRAVSRPLRHLGRGPGDAQVGRVLDAPGPDSSRTRCAHPPHLRRLSRADLGVALRRAPSRARRGGPRDVTDRGMARGGRGGAARCDGHPGDPRDRGLDDRRARQLLRARHSPACPHAPPRPPRPTPRSTQSTASTASSGPPTPASTGCADARSLPGECPPRRVGRRDPGGGRAAGRSRLVLGDRVPAGRCAP